VGDIIHTHTNTTQSVFKVIYYFYKAGCSSIPIINLVFFFLFSFFFFPFVVCFVVVFLPFFYFFSLVSIDLLIIRRSRIG